MSDEDTPEYIVDALADATTDQLIDELFARHEAAIVMLQRDVNGDDDDAATAIFGRDFGPISTRLGLLSIHRMRLDNIAAQMEHLGEDD